MRRDSGKHNHADRLFVETYRKFATVCGNISKTQASNEETYLKESRQQTGIYGIYLVSIPAKIQIIPAILEPNFALFSSLLYFSG